MDPSSLDKALLFAVVIGDRRVGRHGRITNDHVDATMADIP